MEDLAVFTTLNHSGYLGKNFIEIKKKKNYVIFRLRVGLYSEKLLQALPTASGSIFKT